MASKKFLALDVGEKRIGVATADSAVPIAVTYGVVIVDGTEHRQIADIIRSEFTDVIVIGYPRNQSGEPTHQTAYVEKFAGTLVDLGLPVKFQDESLTSVKAEAILKEQKQPYEKGDIDALAATLILQDYLERQ